MNHLIIPAWVEPMMRSLRPELRKKLSLRDIDDLRKSVESQIDAAEREKVADWMTAHSYATGPGDTIDDLLGELSWQIREERERALAVCDEINALSAAFAAERERADRAEDDLERERMRLAACSVVALANTAETAADARDMHPDYDSASARDVAAAVDREMALRERVARLVELLSIAAKYTRHSDYDWDVGFARDVAAALGDK